MGPSELFAIAMVVVLCALLMAGYPVALTLGGVALGFAFAGHWSGVMNWRCSARCRPYVRRHDQRGADRDPAVRVHGRDARTLGRRRGPARNHGPAVRRARGGLAIAVVLVGVLLAAAKGIVGATTVTMGLIVLPTMLRHGYDPRLAAGTVAATGTLAQIFPPATVLVLLGDQISNAYQAAQLAQRIFAPRRSR